MKISQINNKSIYQPKFTSSFRVYSPKANPKFKNFGQMYIRTSTNLLREDINWKNLINYIASHFQNKQVINSYSLASSDGTEAVSYSISMQEFAPKSFLKKLSKIKACDVDSEIIKIAKQRRINIFGVEFAVAEKLYGIDFFKYFENKKESIMIENDDISETDTISSYVPIKSIRDSMDFFQSDALTEINKLNDDGNSIVMFRNVFPYLNYDYIDNVIKTLQYKLRKGSLFIIGDYDREVKNIDKILLNNGFFRPMESELNVFEKM